MIIARRMREFMLDISAAYKQDMDIHSLSNRKGLEINLI